MKPYSQQGGITIYHADCFEILHDLSGVGAVCTDPPYSSGGLTRGDRTMATSTKYVQTGTLEYRPEFAGDSRDGRSFLIWCTMWLSAARRACLDGAPAVVFSDWRQLPTMTDAMQCAGWTWRNIGTWWKPGVRMQRGRFSGSAEYVVYGTNGPVTEGRSSPQNVLEHPTGCPQCGSPDPEPENDRTLPPVVRQQVEKEKLHIAEKPVAVMSWALSVVPEDAVVLDPFMGAGSTLIAAKNMGLQAIGIECDERYCEAAAKRLQQGVMF